MSIILTLAMQVCLYFPNVTTFQEYQSCAVTIETCYQDKYLECLANTGDDDQCEMQPFFKQCSLEILK